MSLTLSDRALARRYARAFYGSVGRDRAPEAAQELTAVAEGLEGGTGEFRDPRLTPEAKKAFLRKALGPSVSPRVLGLLDLLVEKKRLELVGAIAVDFSKLCDEERGVVRAAVRTAAELSPEEGETLKARLSGFLGKDVVPRVSVDPELLGGTEVRVGDWVLDASLRGELRRLRERLAGE